MTREADRGRHLNHGEGWIAQMVRLFIETPKSIKTTISLFALMFLLIVIPSSVLLGFLAYTKVNLTIFHVVLILAVLIVLTYSMRLFVVTYMKGEGIVDVSESTYGIPFEEMMTRIEEEVASFRDNTAKRERFRETNDLQRVFKIWYSNTMWAACSICGNFDPSLNVNLMEWDNESHSLTIHSVNGFYLQPRVFNRFKIRKDEETAEGVCGRTVLSGQITYQQSMEDEPHPKGESRFLKSMMSIPIQKIDSLRDGEIAVLNIDSKKEEYFKSSSELDQNARRLQRLLQDINRLRGKELYE